MDIKVEESFEVWGRYFGSTSAMRLNKFQKLEDIQVYLNKLNKIYQDIGGIPGKFEEICIVELGVKSTSRNLVEDY